MAVNLSTPACEYGYTLNQLEEDLDTDYSRFSDWMDGQTMMICPEHGTIVYTWDVDRFLANRPVID